jgi:hypothetical protein
MVGIWQLNYEAMDEKTNLSNLYKIANASKEEKDDHV